MPEAASDAPEVEYILGHSERELRRLRRQAAVLRPITERLLRSAGIGHGMRVLDLGCGAGDVSILAADLVGASGSVVGIDWSQDAIAVAAERARTAKLRQVDFRHVSLETFADPEPFDAVIGRYILIHQADPAAFLRAAVDLLRPGGIVAFHELCFQGQVAQSFPQVALWQQCAEWIQTAFQAVAPHFDAGGRLTELFAHAGIPRPNLFCESPIDSGASSPFYAWIADTVESVLPQLVRMRVLPADTAIIQTLESQLRNAVVAAHSQIVAPAQYCAWVRV